MTPYADPYSEAAKISQKRRSARAYAKHREREIARAAKYNRDHKERVNINAVRRRSTKMPPERVLWWNARNRAIAKGIEFSLTLEDTVVPSHCPVLGIPLIIATGYAQAGSPSVDRIDPMRGYVRGNVRVISHKANTIKSNATVEELRRVLAYMENPDG